MERNLLGVLVSYAFIFLVLSIALLLARSNKFSSEFVRKFVHILVSQWWFIYATFFTDVFYSIFVPTTFVVFNALAIFTDFTKYFKSNDRKRNYGLIYFPISLTLLCILHAYEFIPKISVGIGIMTMGYSDGLAAVIGQKYGKNRFKSFPGGKSYEGSFTFLVVTFLVILSFLTYYEVSLDDPKKIIYIFAIALIETVIEAYTPYGLDNITIPLSSALLCSKYL